MLSALVLVASVLTGFVAAQSPNTDFNASLPQIIKEVDLALRSAWCVSEGTTCSFLCGSQTTKNDCDPTSLSYHCVCSQNNSAPALQYYIGSLTSNLCNQTRGDCVASNHDNLVAQNACSTSYICATLNTTVAAAAATGGSTSGSSSPATASATATGTAGAATGGSGGSATGTAAPSASKSSTAMALKMGQEYGMGLLAAGMMGVLAL